MQENKKTSGMRGFTLLEIVVVLAIFSVLVVMITDVFLMVLTAQRQASQRQKVLANLRYITETIARQVRTSEIDYEYYDNSNPNIPKDKLALKDIDGNSFVYSNNSGEMKLSVYDQTLNLISSDSLTNLEEVQVVKLLFYINPSTNPFSEERCNDYLDSNGCKANVSCTVEDPDEQLFGFCLCAGSNDCTSGNCVDDTISGRKICLPFDYQPRVTMVLGFESVAVKPEEQKTIYLQTTVSSRIYKR